MKHPPPLELVTTEDFDLHQPVPSEWARIYRMLAQIFEAQQEMQQTQLKQLEITKETCARVTLIEAKIK